MRKIPESLRKEILADRYFNRCARHKERRCQGRITWEHAWIYAGKQINELWAIIPLCEYHHEVGAYQDCGDLDKDLGRYLSLRRATDADLGKYPKKDWKQLKKALNAKYLSY